MAHLLLAKIYKETDYFEPLIYAIQCMQNSNGRNKRFRHSSRIFQKERMKASKRNLQKMQDKRSKKITWRNETHTFREWGKILNIHPKTLANKYRSGKSLDEIIITTNRNTRKLIEFKGRKLTLKDWANELNISHSNLHNRIYHLGWSIEKAFTTPYMNPSEKHYKRKYLY